MAGFSLFDLGACNCSGGGGFACGSCSIPEADLTLSWTNAISGPGSVPLVYSITGGVPKWQSACGVGTDYITYVLSCVSGTPVFTAWFTTTSGCGVGFLSCSTSTPGGFTQTSLTCGSAFDMEITVSDTLCSSLSSNGYTDFSVTA